MLLRRSRRRAHACGTTRGSPLKFNAMQACSKRTLPRDGARLRLVCCSNAHAGFSGANGSAIDHDAVSNRLEGDGAVGRTDCHEDTEL